MNKNDILEQLNAFPYGHSGYWIVAGGAMVLYGIREETADIDLGCTPKLADLLERDGYLVRRTESGNRYFRYGDHIEISENWLYDTFTEVEGIQTISIKGLLEMKHYLGRDKDLRDIELIHKFMADLKIVPFEKQHIVPVIEFEKELRRQEPDTYYWEPDEAYKQALEASFSDDRFRNALSFIAVRGDKVIGRIDAVVIAGRSDPGCGSAYLDWICVLKNERHNKVAQALLEALRGELRTRNITLLIALMAQNDEAQSFYRSVEGASVHDEGIWIDI